MLYKIRQLLADRDIESRNFPVETLYKVGMDNVRDNIEFYFDKPYTCESVIQELFVRGIVDYIERSRFPYLEK